MYSIELQAINALLFSLNMNFYSRRFIFTDEISNIPIRQNQNYDKDCINILKQNFWKIACTDAVQY